MGSVQLEIKSKSSNSIMKNHPINSHVERDIQGENGLNGAFNELC